MNVEFNGLMVQRTIPGKDRPTYRLEACILHFTIYFQQINQTENWISNTDDFIY